VHAGDTVSRVEFEQHWTAHRSTQIPAGKAAVARKFLEPLVRFAADQGPIAFLDAGCGDGVHVAALSGSSQLPPGSRCVGLDLSFEALRLATEHASSDWHFVEGDLSRLPFADGVFDAVISFGVLAYTAAPERSFGELCRVTRPGGLIGVWVCPRPRPVARLLLGSVRRICRAVGPTLTRRIADLIVPLLSVLPTRSELSLRNASWKECREVVLVNIAPSRLVFPEPAQIHGWFQTNRVTVVEEDATAPGTLWGVKGNLHS
jgi:ubiquinone/menaquinone biosynthesis C-methylase UbiE